MVDLEGKVRSLLNAKIEAYGIADAGSDADTLVDAERLEANNYWDGLTLLMLTGNNAGLSRPIVEWMLGVGIEVRPAFPNAIAAGDIYVILSNYHEIVPTADTTDDYQPRDVIGRKTDTALQAVAADASLMRYIKGLITGQIRQLYSMDFWSAGLEEVQIGDAGAGATVALPNIVVADLPAGAIIVRAIVMFKFRMIENTFAGVNKLNGATVAGTSQVIQIRSDAPLAYVDAINFVDDFFTLGDTDREGGDVIIGTIDVSGATGVDEEDDYNLQWLLGRADFDFINFNDVQVGLRIWYSV